MALQTLAESSTPRAPIPESTRRAIDLARFLCMLLVVCIHSVNLPSDVYSAGKRLDLRLSTAVETVISDGFARAAVPLFFAISGFLFFTPPAAGAIGAWWKSKVGKRLKTLVVPYLIWSALALVIFAGLQSLPAVRPFFSGPLIREYSAAKLLQTFLLDPLPYQLWFVRDLFILTLISPALRLSLERFPIIGLVSIGALWISQSQLPWLSSEGLFFFFAGAWIACRKNRWPECEPSNPAQIWFGVAWIACITAHTITALQWGHETANLLPLKKIGELFGCISLWWLSSLCIRKSPKLLHRFVGLAIFLYLAHEPLLTMIKKPLLKVLGGSGNFAYLATYASAAAATIVVCLSAGAWARKHIPVIYAVLTGGRGESPTPQPSRRHSAESG